MLKVKLIHPSWLSAPNGANAVMNELLASEEQFKKNGLEITSLSPDIYAPRSFDIMSQGSYKAVWRAKLKRWLKWATKFSRIASDLIIYITEIRPSKKIVRMYVESNPDPNEVVFFHAMIPCYYYLKSRRIKQHSVVVFHTNGDNLKMARIYYPMLEHSIMYKKMMEMEKYVVDHVDRINFVASMAKVNFLKLHPEIDSSKVSYIYNGLKDLTFFQRPRVQSKIIKFCCVASISKRKGQHYIIDALKMFRKDEMPKVHFTFVGDGIDREVIEADVKNNNLEKYVTFVGISHNVDDYLVNSDVFILPSDDEGLPIAIIEAMRASLPIVSTPVGGIPEMINDGVNGLLIQPSTQDVYDILCHIDNYNWEKMGVNARKIFQEKFTLNRMIEGYTKLLSF